MNTIKIKLLHPSAKPPAFAHPGEDAAFDLFSCEPCWIRPRDTGQVRLGFASEFPAHLWIKIEGKSGLASRSIEPMGGVIDSGYRGEWIVILHNHSSECVQIEAGTAVAQAVVHVKVPLRIEVAAELAVSKRGENGMGSGHKAP